MSQTDDRLTAMLRVALEDKTASSGEFDEELVWLAFPFPDRLDPPGRATGAQRVVGTYKRLPNGRTEVTLTKPERLRGTVIGL